MKGKREVLLKTDKLGRPDWDSMFLIEAAYWSLRTSDAETGNGCILVRDKTIISHGFNGFIRNIDGNQKNFIGENIII